MPVDIHLGNILAALATLAYVIAIAYVAGWSPRGQMDRNPKVSGRRLHLALGLWLIVLLATVVSFAVAMPSRREQILALHQAASPAQDAVMRALGLSAPQHVALVLATDVVVAVVFGGVALFIVLQRPRDWVAMLASASLATYIVWASAPLDAMAAREPVWQPATNFIQVLGMTNMLVFLLVFPDGRPVPRWSPALLVGWTFWAVLWALFPASRFNLSDLFGMPVSSFASLVGWWTAGMGAQVYRFYRVASPVQRHQTKWIISAAAVATMGHLLFGIHRLLVAPIHEPTHAGAFFDLVAVPIFLLILLVVPVAFAFSILRYRLWDIDLVISRALTYGALASILGGMYSASITLSQRLFVAITGEESDAAIVVTTLVVGATFTQVRERLQRMVDGLVRERPDRMAAMRALNEELRSFVRVADPEEVTHRAIRESARSLAADSGSIYLLREGRYQLLHTVGEWSQVEGMRAWLECEGVRFGWIALGPRQGGLEYTERDRTAFAETASLVARVLCLARARA